ncbi:hypothetical protein I2486_21550 [Cellulophaga sp. E16_2]|uniref:hypothetical protein n=1 Tax=Cellulophaga sp. E16_2 TaxID=2789297 RepID=UPI001A92C4E1|nr:hypothetical protein [Cellulophaga sp. E16_2]MBO0593994.1 hypothetical protein [Cellulophaga sp. E16_2]
MGYWCTLHLFNEEKFYSETVLELKGQVGNLLPSYKEFLRTNVTGGINHLTIKEIDELALSQLEKIYKISNSFNETFKNYPAFHSLKNWDLELNFLGSLEGHYEFCKFFEYYIFEKCSDFYPHIPLGKGGVTRNFDLKPNTYSNNIIGALDSWNHFFLQDMFGITNWISNEDIELLILDKQNLVFEENIIAEATIRFIEIANQNKLRLLAGVDLDIDRNELLPQNKLITSDLWND